MATIPKIRIWYPTEVEIFNNSTIDRLQRLGYEVYAITVEGVIAGSDGATSFDDATTVLDGTSTADSIYLESTDALDKNAAAGAVRTVTMNIVNSSGDPYRSVQNLDSADGTTAVLASDTAVRLYNIYSSDFGTGGSDAEGNITAGDDDVPTNTFVTITAADNESDGARIWVPDGYKSIIENVTISIQDKALAAVNNGCWIQIDKVGFEDTLNTAVDDSAQVVVACVGSQGYISVKPQHYPDTGTSTAYYLLKESRITGAETCMCYMLFILYKNARDGL